MTPREYRVLRWGVATIGLGWVLLRGLPALVRSEQALRNRVAVKSSELERASTDVASLDSLEGAATRIQVRVKAIASQLLSGGTASEAAADVSAQTRALIEGQGARVDAVQAMGDSSLTGGMRSSRLRLEMTTDTPGLFAILAAIDHYPILLTVNFVKIVSSDAGGSDGGPENLRIELGIAGFYLQRKEGP